MRLESETRRFYLGRDYSEALEASGATPVHLALIPKAEYIASAIDGLDGILLPGSDTDVDPALFGERPHPKLKRVVPEKDETDRMVIAEAERRGLPLFAICYGMQALNVARGGTLIQDIASDIEGGLKHDREAPANDVYHEITVENESILGTLSSVAGNGDVVRVNSSHHQAIGKIGRGLKATAWAKDGVVEGIQDTRGDKFMLGVQWHPELSWNSDRFSKEIFDLFVAKCGQKTAPEY